MLAKARLDSLGLSVFAYVLVEQSLRRAMSLTLSRSSVVLLSSHVRPVLYPSIFFLKMNSVAIPNRRDERMHPCFTSVITLNHSPKFAFTFTVQTAP